MKISVFTSNQPRHIHLIESLAQIAETVYAVQEVTTIFPGITDDFYKKSDVMKDYFQHVMCAEKNIFDVSQFLSKNVKSLSLKMGDLNQTSLEILRPALNSDVYIVFGASYIKSALVDFLVEKKALNIHMGVSPFYRGSSCNFWAIHDGNSDLVGATIHLLSKGLDSGDMLYHALPKVPTPEIFDLGMMAVKSAHVSLVEKIKTREIFDLRPVKQDKAEQIRYSRYVDFDDEVAGKFLNDLPDFAKVESEFLQRSQRKLLNPFFY